MEDLARLYEKGEGVIRSEEKALYWINKSCENGYEKACEVLKYYEETQENSHLYEN